MPKPLSVNTMAAAAPIRLQGEKSTGRRSGHGNGTPRPRSRLHLAVRRSAAHARMAPRYASMDETDAHGGSVMLTDDGQLSDLKDGDIILVKGRLQDPDSRTATPVYVVSDVRAQR